MIIVQDINFLFQVDANGMMLNASWGICSETCLKGMKFKLLHIVIVILYIHRM